MVKDAHLLERQVAFASREGETIVGLKAFMLRMAKVQETREHSAEDLLHFLKANDLPLTESGQIIAYKRLLKVEDHYVDSHTQKVKQRIGSRVFMSENMVNPTDVLYMPNERNANGEAGSKRRGADGVPSEN